MENTKKAVELAEKELLKEKEREQIETVKKVISNNPNSCITKSSAQKVIYVDGKNWTSDSWIFNGERVSFTN